jgi:SAM-dependent methyltransferase
VDPFASGEVAEGTLSCPSCERQYSIRGGIPRFVDESVSSHVDIETGSHFGQSWKKFARLDRRYRRQFFDWLAPVGAAYLKGKLVLEGGCGKGRHAKIVSEAGASEVFAVDIGDAVEVAYENVGRLPGVHIMQADIRNLPFGRTFDYCFSLGVLHHLEDPLNGFVSLVRKVKPTGAISVWVYGRENNWWLVKLVNPLRESITCKLHPQLLMVLSALLTLPLFLASKFFFYPWSWLTKRYPHCPRLFYQDYMSYLARHDFEELHHIVFDHLVTPVAHYIRKEEFSSWFKDVGFEDPVIRWHNKNSWSGFYSYSPPELKEMRQHLDQPAARAKGSLYLPESQKA